MYTKSSCCTPETYYNLICQVYPNMGFPGGSAGKESACNVGDLGPIPGLQRSPREGNSYPLQYPGLENSWGCKESDTTERLTHSPRYSLKKKKKCFYDNFKKLWMTCFFSDNAGSIHDLKSENKNKCNAISSDTNPMLLECFIALNLLWYTMNKGHDAFSLLNGRKKREK